MPNRTSVALLVILLPGLLIAGSSSRPKEVFTPSGTFPGIVLQPIATGLGPLTSITHAGDDRLFLTRRNGLVLILKDGTLQPEPFLDLSALTTTESERGLLSIAFHPRYAENGLFFVDYTDLAGNVVIARYQVAAGDPDRADPASAAILLTIPKTTAQHNGGQLHFGPDGDLYISVGDNAGLSPTEACAAQEGGLLGRILRLDVDTGSEVPPYHSIPADNPFVGDSSVRDEVWASGLRNPWRFSFDRATGDLWIADVGATQREEINFQPAGSPGGQNYGWKIMEGSLCFRDNNCPADVPPCGSPLFTLPVLEYGHEGDDCSVTGGYVYRGTALPQLHGAYVFGDFCTGRIWAADRRGAGFRVREVSATARLLTTFGEDRDGEIYLATITGSLFRLAGRAPADTVAVHDPVTATFLFRDLHAVGTADRALVFSPSGSGGALPVAGDWNGDGRDTVGLWLPDTGRFLLKNTLLRGRQDVNFALPVPRGMIPLAGDWNGDGRDSVGLYDPATGTFQVKNTLAAGRFDTTFRFPGAGSTWLPVVGDWNGDGKDTVGLYDPATSTFRLKSSFQGSRIDATVRFGPANSGWAPLAGDWDGDGRDTIGFYDPETGIFRLKDSLRNGGVADWVFQFGEGGGLGRAVVGEW